MAYKNPFSNMGTPSQRESNDSRWREIFKDYNQGDIFFYSRSPEQRDEDLLDIDVNKRFTETFSPYVKRGLTQTVAGRYVNPEDQEVNSAHPFIVKANKSDFEERKLGLPESSYAFDYLNQLSNPELFYEDATKGFGNVNDFQKYATMDREGKEELLKAYEEGRWKTPAELEKEVRDFKKDVLDPRMNIYQLDPLLTASTFKQISSTNNQDVLNDIYDRYLERQAKKKQVVNDEAASRDRLSQMDDSEVQDLFMKYITPNNDEGILGDTYMAGYFLTDDDFKFKDEYTIEDKKDYIAKYEAYYNNFAPGTAHDMITHYSEELIKDKMTFGQKANRLFNDIGHSAGAYVAEGMLGIQLMRDTALDAIGGKLDLYMDTEGNYYTPEEVSMQIVIGDDGKKFFQGTVTVNGEEIAVYPTQVSRADLSLQGKKMSNGTIEDYSDFFNQQYWSNVEQYSTWDSELHQKYKEMGLTSPYKPMFDTLAGEMAYESGKMSSFMVVDMAISALTATPQIAAAKNLINATKATRIATVLNTVNATRSSIAIADAYGVGVYQETLQNNLSAVNQLVQAQAKQNIKDKITNNSEYNDKYQSLVQIYMQQLYNKYAAEQKETAASGEGKTVYFMPSEEIIKGQAIQLALKDLLTEEVTSLVESPDYISQISQSHNAAVDATTVSFLTEALKYQGVNMYGYRQVFFKDMQQLVKNNTKRMFNSGIKGLKENANKQLEYTLTPKTTIQSFGKILAKQVWGGAWTNYTDEMQSAGAKQINNEVMTAYLNGVYDVDALRTVLDYSVPLIANLTDESDLKGHLNVLTKTGSFIQGAIASMPKAQTIEAGGVGGGGSLIGVGLNGQGVLHLATSREAWKGGVLGVLNNIVSNGILQEWNALKLSQNQIKAEIDFANKIIKEAQELSPLIDGFSAEITAMDVMDPNSQKVLKLMQAAQYAASLSRLENSPLTEYSSVLQQQLKMLQELAQNDKLSDETRKYVLDQYYKANPTVAKPKTTDNKTQQDRATTVQETEKQKQLRTQQEEEIIHTVRKNAREVLENKERYEQEIEPILNQARKRFIKDNGYDIPWFYYNQLKKQLIFESVIGREYSKNEAQLNPTGVKTGTSAAVFGNEKGLKERQEGLNTVEKNMQQTTEEARQTWEKAHKAVQDALKKYNKLQKKKKTRDSEAAKETKEVLKKLANAEAHAHYIYESYSSVLKAIKADKKAIAKLKLNEGKVLTKEQILGLSAADRFFMLNEENFDLYSEEQQKVITELKEELGDKGMTLVNQQLDFDIWIDATSRITKQARKNLTEAVAHYNSQLIKTIALVNDLATIRTVKRWENNLKQSKDMKMSDAEIKQSILDSLYQDSKLRMTEKAVRTMLQALREYPKEFPILKQYEAFISRVLENAIAKNEITELLQDKKYEGFKQPSLDKVNALLDYCVKNGIAILTSDSSLSTEVTNLFTNKDALEQLTSLLGYKENNEVGNLISDLNSFLDQVRALEEQQAAINSTTPDVGDVEAAATILDEASVPEPADAPPVKNETNALYKKAKEAKAPPTVLIYIDSLLSDFTEENLKEAIKHLKSIAPNKAVADVLEQLLNNFDMTLYQQLFNDVAQKAAQFNSVVACKKDLIKQLQLSQITEDAYIKAILQELIQKSVLNQAIQKATSSKEIHDRIEQRGKEQTTGLGMTLKARLQNDVELFEASDGFYYFPDGVLLQYYKTHNMEGAIKKVQDRSFNKAQGKYPVVYFMVDPELNKKVAEAMSGSYKATNDMPIIAVVEDKDGPITVNINGEVTRVAPIAFLPASNNSRHQGNGIIGKIRDNAIQGITTSSNAPFIVTSKNKPLLSAVVEVKVTSNYKQTANPAKSENSVLTIIEKDAIKEAEQSKNSPEAQAVQATVQRKSKSFIEKYIDPFVARLKVKKASNPNATDNDGQRNTRSMLVVETTTNTGRAEYREVFVKPIDLTKKDVNGGQKTLIELLKDKRVREAVDFNMFTRAVHKTLSEALTSAVRQYDKNDSDSEKTVEQIVQEALDKIDTYFLRVANIYEYRCTVEHGEIKINLQAIQQGANDIDLLRIPLSDIDALSLDEATLQQMTSLFMSNLLIDPTTQTIRKNPDTNLKQDAMGDHNIAHWQINYNNITEWLQTIYENTNDNVDAKALQIAHIQKQIFENIVLSDILYCAAVTFRQDNPSLTFVSPFGASKSSIKTEEEVRADLNKTEQPVATTPKGSEKESVLERLKKLIAGTTVALSNPNDPYYKSSSSNTLFMRVTTALYGIFGIGTSERPEVATREDGTLKGKLMVSSHLGNTIDKIGRDVLEGSTKSTDNDLMSKYPNYTLSHLQSIVQQFEQFKQKREEEGITLLSKGVTVTGTVMVQMPDGSKQSVRIAGTLDIIGVDADGNIHIYDMKTIRNKNYRTDTAHTQKWEAQLSLYAKMLTDQGYTVKEISVIPIHTMYNAPVGDASRSDARSGLKEIDYYEREGEDQLYDENGKKILLADASCKPVMLNPIELHAQPYGTDAMPMQGSQYTEAERNFITTGTVNGATINLTGTIKNNPDDTAGQTKGPVQDTNYTGNTTHTTSDVHHDTTKTTNDLFDTNTQNEIINCDTWDDVLNIVTPEQEKYIDDYCKARYKQSAEDIWEQMTLPNKRQLFKCC